MCIFIKNCTFPPLVGAQRAHSAFRAYGGRTASFRAYGGHKVPLSPTAFPEKAKLKRVCFLLHRGSSTEARQESS